MAWGEAPLSVFWQGHPLCVNEAELKESFTERGSGKGMCRMRLAHSNRKEHIKETKYIQQLYF